jgi:hypothetical protein
LKKTDLEKGEKDLASHFSPAIIAIVPRRNGNSRTRGIKSASRV